eukprot:363651-Chlamydomonas_euryale.AAC.1
MTPVGVAPYFVATVFGAAFWSVLYCSLGAASRELLEGGMDLGELLEGISQQAGSYSAVALKVTAGVAAAGGVALAVRSALGAQDGGGGDPPAPPPQPADTGKSAPARGEGSPEARVTMRDRSRWLESSRGAGEEAVRESPLAVGCRAALRRRPAGKELGSLAAREF